MCEISEMPRKLKSRPEKRQEETPEGSKKKISNGKEKFLKLK